MTKRETVELGKISSKIRSENNLMAAANTGTVGPKVPSEKLLSLRESLKQRKLAQAKKPAENILPENTPKAVRRDIKPSLIKEHVRHLPPPTGKMKPTAGGAIAATGQDDQIMLPRMFYDEGPAPSERPLPMHPILATLVPGAVVLGAIAFFALAPSEREASMASPFGGDSVYASFTDSTKPVEFEKPGAHGTPVPEAAGRQITQLQANGPSENSGELDRIGSEPMERALNDIASIVTVANRGPAKVLNRVAENNTAAPAANANDRKIRALTEEVVNALSTLKENKDVDTGPLQNSVDKLRDSLARLVVEAQSQGKNRGSLESLVKEAIGGREDSLPGALKNADGTLNISVLLNSIVKKASDTSAAGASGGNSYLAMITKEGQQTQVLPFNLNRTKGIRYFVVKPGDTLSSIAFKLYGDAFLYPKLFNANRKILKTPNDLEVGMKLVIPK